MLERASRVDTRGWRESPAVKRGQDECRDQYQGDAELMLAMRSTTGISSAGGPPSVSKREK